jgi:osmotically inducible protein OsmC
MAVRYADAEWKGNLQSGKGNIRLGTGGFEGGYTYKSRFEEGPGTNPEELIAGADGACFTMAFASGLTKAGFAPALLKTHAEVIMEKVDNRDTITRIQLTTEGQVPGIDDKQFQEIGEGAKKNCPIARALNPSIQVTLNAKLVK